MSHVTLHETRYPTKSRAHYRDADTALGKRIGERERASSER